MIKILSKAPTLRELLRNELECGVGMEMDYIANHFKFGPYYIMSGVVYERIDIPRIVEFGPSHGQMVFNHENVRVEDKEIIREVKKALITEKRKAFKRVAKGFFTYKSKFIKDSKRRIRASNEYNNDAIAKQKEIYYDLTARFSNRYPRPGETKSLLALEEWFEVNGVTYVKHEQKPIDVELELTKKCYGEDDEDATIEKVLKEFGFSFDLFNEDWLIDENGVRIKVSFLDNDIINITVKGDVHLGAFALGRTGLKAKGSGDE